MKNLEAYSVLKDKFLNPIYVGIYFFLIFGLGLFFDLSLLKISALILFPVVLFFVSLDITWNMLILLLFFFWKSITLAGGRETYILNSLIFFIPFAFLTFILKKNELDRKNTIVSKKNSLFLLIAVLLSLIFARNVNRSVYWIFCFIQPVIVYYWLKIEVDSIDKLKKIYLLILVGLNITLLFGLKDIIFSSGRVYGISRNPNELASIMAFAIFFILPIIFYNSKKSIKILGLIFLFLTVLVLMGTQSRGGQLAVIGGLFFYFISRRKDLKGRLFYVTFFILMLLIIVLTFGDVFLSRFSQIKELGYSELDRIGMWISAWKLFKESPLVGIGINNYYEYYTAYHPFFDLINLKQLAVAHNLYLNTLAELGIIGFLALIGFLYSLQKNIREYINSENDFLREISLSLWGYFFYFLIHNAVDCPWTAYGHDVALLTFIFVLFFLNKRRLLVTNEK